MDDNEGIEEGTLTYRIKRTGNEVTAGTITHYNKDGKREYIPNGPLREDYLNDILTLKASEYKPRDDVSFTKRESSQIIYTYDYPASQMSNAEKAEAYLDWTEQDKFFRPKYEEWAIRKFNGLDPADKIKVSPSTLHGWKKYAKLIKNS